MNLNFFITVSFSALVILMFSISHVGGQAQQKAELLYTFNYLNFTWENSSLYQQWATAEGWKDCMLAGIKVSSKGDIYVSVPRWKPNVPATLNKLVTINNMVLLQPFPSWAMNEAGNSAALQSVLGFEIDSQDRLWIVDQGKVAGDPAIPGSIKLVVWDLNTNTQVQSYPFPEDQASLEGSFLNDIVIDETNNFAYITDTGVHTNLSQSTNGSLIAFNVATNTSQRILSGYPSVNANESLWITINGIKVLSSQPFWAGADGIALHPNDTTLYWCSLTSWQYYSIPTSFLRNFSVSDEVRNAATQTYYKGFASDGLGMDNLGKLYFTSLEKSGIFNASSKALTATPSTITTNTRDMIWPDTMGFDNNGSILFVTNHLMLFWEGLLNYSGKPSQNSPQSKTPSNYCIWKVFVGANSYLDPTKYVPPKKEGPPAFVVVVLVIVAIALVVTVLLFIWCFFVIPWQQRNNRGIDFRPLKEQGYGGTSRNPNLSQRNASRQFL